MEFLFPVCSTSPINTIWLEMCSQFRWPPWRSEDRCCRKMCKVSVIDFHIILILAWIAARSSFQIFFKVFYIVIISTLNKCWLSYTMGVPVSHYNPVHPITSAFISAVIHDFSSNLFHIKIKSHFVCEVWHPYLISFTLSWYLGSCAFVKVLLVPHILHSRHLVYI